MSDTPITPDDPRLTAYVLGELSDAERETVEAHLTTSPACRRAVEELRATTVLLDEALQSEPVTTLTDTQRSAIHSAATTGSVPRSPTKRVAVSNNNRSESSQRRAVTTALLTVLAVSVALLLAVVLPVNNQPAPDGIAMVTQQTQSDSYGVDFAEIPNHEDLTQQRLEYFRISENSPGNDVDSVLQFAVTPQATEQSSDANSPHVAYDHVSSESVVVPFIASSENLQQQTEQDFLPVAPLGSVDPINSPTDRNSSRFWSFSGSKPATKASTPSSGQQMHSPASVSRFSAETPVDRARLYLSPQSNGKAPANTLKEQSFWKELDETERGAIFQLADDNSSAVSSHLGLKFVDTQTLAAQRAAEIRELREELLVMNDELSKQVSLSFTEAPLTEVLQHLATDAKINLMIDERSLSEIGLTSQVPITINVEGIKLKSALNLILKPMRLDYRVDDGVLVISSTYQHNFESYAPIVENPFTSPVDAPLSTFGLDVDTASYANVRRFLLDEGRLPPPDAVRIEELVNSFSYDDPQPVDEHPLRVSLESAACPWDATHRLVRIGVKGKEIDLADRPPTSLVFLIDTSGSMRDDNKLPLVKESLRLLVDEMSENDRIAIVTYSNDAGLLLDSTSGEHRDEIMSIIDSLSAGGSTNGEAGLKTAYEVATQHKIDNGSNRVILCTDGDFNVGESADAPLVQMISGKRDTGVFLSIFGFGTGNLKDAKLEQIADHGNGHYHYIDGLRQARKVFLDELTGMLYTIAQDVKLQIEFNPAHVGAYRLIGYENRTLAAEDFNNDQIDAGDLGAGHSVCALYEIVPPHALPMRQPNEPNVDPLKYQPAESQETRAESKDASKTAPAIEPDSQPSTTNPQLSSDLPATPEELRTVLDIIAKEKQAFEQHTKELQEEFGAEHPGVIAARKQMQELQSRIRQLERHQLELNEATPRTVSPDLLTVKLRYKRPTFFTSQKLEFPLIDDPDKQSRSNNLEWSAAVASFGMLLRNSAYLGNAKFDSVLELARDAMGDDRSGQRAEFIDMVLRARQLHRQSHGTDSPPPPELSSLEARRKASLDGRYEDLLDKIQRPEDFKQYGAFHNRGWWTGPQDADEKGYPAGYWVYVYPHWYVWSETVSFDSPSSSRKRNPLGRPPVDSH